MRNAAVQCERVEGSPLVKSILVPVGRVVVASNKQDARGKGHSAAFNFCGHVITEKIVR